MKIENRGIAITEVSRITVLHVTDKRVTIGFTGASGTFNFTREELQEVHAAIGEALKYMEASSAENSTEPRVWNDGDPEPGDVTVVIDCDGDRWVKETYSGVTKWRYGEAVCDWGQLLRGYEPVREAK